MNIVRSANERVTRFFNLNNLIAAHIPAESVEPEITLHFMQNDAYTLHGDEAKRMISTLETMEHQTTLRWLGKAMQTKPDGAK